MYRYVLVILMGLVGLASAGVAQEVTAAGTYKGQDYALSRRVEILRAALDATVQQVQKMAVCNSKGLMYVSGSTVSGLSVDADGCAQAKASPDCIKVVESFGVQQFYGNVTVERVVPLFVELRIPGADSAHMNYPRLSQVSSDYTKVGTIKTFSRINTDGGRRYSSDYIGYTIDAYCKLDAR